MDIISATRQMEEHKRHLARIRSMETSIDTTTPKSLGLKHLASRPKKQQLIDDRQQSIAKENKKLMERMTKIMSETRSQPKHLKPESRSFSKVEVDRINLENKLLIHRLKTVPPVIDLDEMKQHFNRHCKIGSNLRRRQIKPLTNSKDGKSRVSPTDAKESLQTGGSFDSLTYNSHQTSNIMLNGGDSMIDGESPIKSMSEFRKHVLSTKKMANSFIPKASTNSSINQSDTKYEFINDPK